MIRMCDRYGDIWECRASSVICATLCVLEDVPNTWRLVSPQRESGKGTKNMLQSIYVFTPLMDSPYDIIPLRMVSKEGDKLKATCYIRDVKGF